MSINNNHNLIFFDFCAGIGSAHLAFKNLGLECAGYSEIDGKAEATYKLFHGSKYKNYGDLMKINPESLKDFDILLAGFPCQAFSIVGKRKGFEDESFVLRGSLYQTLLKYLENKYNKGKYNLDELLKQNYLVIDTRQSDLRLYYNKIPTLRTGRQGILYIKDNRIRKLSGLEALLLQGFDLEKAQMAQEQFTQTSILVQAGNAMTVNVMQEIGKGILEYLS